MTDNKKLSCLIDRPCTACKFHKEEGCSKWSCIFEEKSDVPEGEYIKKEDALKKAEEWIDRTFSFGGALNKFKEFENFENFMGELPTYSVPEREKGEWIEKVDDYGTYKCVDGYHCSICHGYNDYKENFCPNCGADMRGGKE